MKPILKGMHKMSEKQQLESDFPKKLAKPAIRALNGAGLTKLEQLTTFTEAELLELHGMGPKAMELIRQALSVRGIDFKNNK